MNSEATRSLEWRLLRQARHSRVYVTLAEARLVPEFREPNGVEISPGHPLCGHPTLHDYHHRIIIL